MRILESSHANALDCWLFRPAGLPPLPRGPSVECLCLSMPFTLTAIATASALRHARNGRVLSPWLACGARLVLIGLIQAGLYLMPTVEWWRRQQHGSALRSVLAPRTAPMGSTCATTSRTSTSARRPGSHRGALSSRPRSTAPKPGSTNAVGFLSSSVASRAARRHHVLPSRGSLRQLLESQVKTHHAPIPVYRH